MCGVLLTPCLPPLSNLSFLPPRAMAAEKTANAVLSINPDVLVIIEGLDYALQLRDARFHQPSLIVPNKMVWSLHDYSWSQSARNYNDWKAIMDDNWGFLLEVSGVCVWCGCCLVAWVC